MSDAPAWQTDLALAAREYWLCDGQIEGLQRLSAGASAETWRFDFITGTARYPCILRRDALASDASMSLCISKSLEFAVVGSAQSAGVPAAEPYFEFQSGYVMQRLDGETLPRKILRDERYASARPRLTGQCAQALARIHATPTLSHLPALNAEAQLQELERLYRDYALASPTFAVAFRWLREHLPPTGELTLVHGDFRNGNLMVDGNGLRGVLDWELAHCGDPAEDLGWLCVNAWRFGKTHLPAGGFGTREALLDAYARHSGRRISAAHLHFWEVFGTLRWGIICLYQVFSHLRGLQFSLELAAIGRRVSEVEMDLLMLLAPSHLTTRRTRHV